MSASKRPAKSASSPVSDRRLFQFATDVRVRLPETDAMGIVFHGYFFTYLVVGRMDYLRNLGLAENTRPIRSFSNLVRRASCEFLSPARFDDPLVIHVRLASIGHSSFRFEFLIRHKQDNRDIARGESIHVAVDDQTMRPRRVPDDFREVIRRYEGADLVETSTVPVRTRATSPRSRAARSRRS